MVVGIPLPNPRAFSNSFPGTSPEAFQELSQSVEISKVFTFAEVALCGYPWIFFVFFIEEFPSGIFGDSRESLFGKSKTFGKHRSSGWSPMSTNKHQWTPMNNLTSKWQKHESSTACLADDLRCWQDGCSLGKIDVLQAALRIR